MCINNNVASIFISNLDDIILSVGGAATMSENKHFKSCLFVVLQEDLTKHGFHLLQLQQKLFILGSYHCSKWSSLS